MVQGALEVGHRQALVDRQALDLVEDGGVRGVQLVGAERLAGHHDVHRQVALQQGARLHRRGVGAQHQARPGRVDEEGVLHLPRRVVGQEVQGVEVEPLGLDLGTVGDLPAHPDEDVADPLDQRGERVPRPGRVPVDRQRDVDRLLDEHPGVALGLQHLVPGRERLPHRAPGLPHARAGLGPRRRRQRADLAVGQGQGAAVAVVRQPRGLELLERRRRGERRERLGDGGLDRLRGERGDLDGVVGGVRGGHGARVYEPSPGPSRTDSPSARAALHDGARAVPRGPRASCSEAVAEPFDAGVRAGAGRGVSACAQARRPAG